MPIKFYTPEFYVFNNFSAHAIEFRGTLYPTSEHAYQAAKCTDPQGQEAIRNARSPLQAKLLANETYRAAKDPNWGSKKVAVLEESCDPNWTSTQKPKKRCGRAATTTSSRIHRRTTSGAKVQTALGKTCLAGSG